MEYIFNPDTVAYTYNPSTAATVSKQNNTKITTSSDQSDEKAVQVSDLILNSAMTPSNDTPSASIPQPISMDVNISHSNYQNHIYDPSPMPESEPPEIDTLTLYSAQSSFPSLSDSQYFIIPDDYKQRAPITVTVPMHKHKNISTQNRFSNPPNKPMPPTPTKKTTNKTEIITVSDHNMRQPIKWVNFIARVKSHQTKQIYQTFSYYKNGYEQSTNIVLGKLELTDQNLENGLLMIDGKKLYVFLRNLQCKFPFEMALRTNTNNEYDALQMLLKIVSETNLTMQQMGIHDVGTFDYGLHFDNAVNRLVPLPNYNPTFYTKQK